MLWVPAGAMGAVQGGAGDAPGSAAPMLQRSGAPLPRVLLCSVPGLLPGQSRAQAAVTVQWHPEVLPGKSGCVAAHEASEPPAAAEGTWVLPGQCPAAPASPWGALPFRQGCFCCKSSSVAQLLAVLFTESGKGCLFWWDIVAEKVASELLQR